MVQDLVHNLENIPQIDRKNCPDFNLNLQTISKISHKLPSKCTDSSRFSASYNLKMIPCGSLDPSRKGSVEYLNQLNQTQQTQGGKSSYILARKETVETLQTLQTVNLTKGTCEDAFPTFSEYNETLSKCSKDTRELTQMNLTRGRFLKDGITLFKSKGSLDDMISIRTGSIDMTMESFNKTAGKSDRSRGPMNVINVNSLCKRRSSVNYMTEQSKDVTLEYLPSTTTHDTATGDSQILKLNLDSIDSVKQSNLMVRKPSNQIANLNIQQIPVDLLETDKGTISWRFQNPGSTNRLCGTDSTFQLSDDRNMFVSGSYISKSRRSSQRNFGMKSIESNISRNLNSTLKEFFFIDKDESSYFDERDLLSDLED